MQQCPVCHKEDTAEPTDGKRSKYFPSCSDRGKLIDLGKWLASRYIIQSNVGAKNPDISGRNFQFTNKPAWHLGKERNNASAGS